MKPFTTLVAVVVVLVCADAAYGESPADRARFPANAMIEFSADDEAFGEKHRLKIARDPLLTEVVYDRADPDEIGQWFVVPDNHGMGPGTYYWQACWVDFDSEAPVCTSVRTLHVTTPRIRTLTLSEARWVVRQVFEDHEIAWSHYNGKHYGCRRVSRIRMTCSPSAWAGDTAITARLRMVNRLSGGTRVRGKIVHFNEYCAAVTPERDCTDSEGVAATY